MPTSVFYNNLCAMCLKRGVTLHKLMEEIGVSRSLPGAWKNGSIPTAPTLKKVADYFGVSAEELLLSTPSPEESKRISEGFNPRIQDWNKRHKDLDAIKKKEPNKAVNLILGNLASVVTLGEFASEDKLAVQAALDYSVDTILAILQEKNLHIEALKAELGAAENSLVEKEEIIAGLTAGRKLDDILKERGYVSKDKP